MNCFYHPDRSSVATCSDCGKGLCQECARKWTPVLCVDCADSVLADRQFRLKKALVTSAILFVVTAVVFSIASIQSGDGARGILLGLALGYVVAAIPQGWVALSKITPNIFLFLPIMGWVIYFMIKLTFAWPVGAVMLPVNVFRQCKALIETKRMQNNVH